MGNRRKSLSEPIGYVSVNIPYEILKIGELAYLLGERFQHKGYAKEATTKGLFTEF